MWPFKKKKEATLEEISQACEDVTIALQGRRFYDQELDYMDIAEEARLIIANGVLQEDVIIQDALNNGGKTFKGFILNHLTIRSGDQEMTIKPGDPIEVDSHITLPHEMHPACHYHTGFDTLTYNKLSFLHSIGVDDTGED